jgi:hypothetical protein
VKVWRVWEETCGGWILWADHLFVVPKERKMNVAHTLALRVLDRADRDPTVRAIRIELVSD